MENYITIAQAEMSSYEYLNGPDKEEHQAVYFLDQYGNVLVKEDYHPN